MRRDLAGNYRIRTGGFRIVFPVTGGVVRVWKIGDRRDLYDLSLKSCESEQLNRKIRRFPQTTSKTFTFWP